MIFEPAYAGFCQEYFAALKADRTWKARWIRCRHYWAFSKIAGFFSVVRFAKQVYGLWAKVGP